MPSLRAAVAAALGFGAAAGVAMAQVVDDAPDEVAAPSPAPAWQQSAPTPAPAPAPVPAWDKLVPIEPGGPPAEPVALCDDKPGGPAWFDRMHASLYRSVCLTAARFDGFFGNARFDDDYQDTHGSVAIGTLWSEHEAWKQSIRFRVHIRLPQLSRRFNAFIGRVNPGEYVTNLRDDFDALPRQFSQVDDDTVLAGLGYTQPGPGGGRFDWGAGAKVHWPLDPYAKGTFHYVAPFLDHNLLRLNETAFWQEAEGFGVTTRTDVERLLAETLLLRWTTSGRLSETTDGMRWLSELTLYQGLGSGRALSYQAGLSGESRREVAVANYGGRAIYRSAIHRDWLFLELRGSLDFPRATPAVSREPTLGAGVALEMLFGERSR